MKIGILGGGQLGKMFIQNTLNYAVEVHILDPNPEAPCAKIAENFVCGDFNKKEDVLAFGKNLDYISIEIEHVNLEALKILKSQGKIIVPDPEILEIIQNKGKQKDFYIKNNIPTAPLVNKDTLPVVQKLCTGGYDGKGVQVIQNKDQLHWEDESIYEELADIEKELAVIIGRNKAGEHTIFPIVEQVFDPKYNLLDYLVTPARISKSVEEKAVAVAVKLIDCFDSAGIFAIELFLNKDGSIWVNEVAPRVHNSGHSSIEASYSSQFDVMLRAIMNWPFSSTDLKSNSVMINLIGAEDNTGNAKVEGLSEILKTDGAQIHWYGKKITKPGRKMGHITICGKDLEELEQTAILLKNKVAIISIEP